MLIAVYETNHLENFCETI